MRFAPTSVETNFIYSTDHFNFSWLVAKIYKAKMYTLFCMHLINLISTCELGSLVKLHFFRKKIKGNLFKHIFLKCSPTMCLFFLKYVRASLTSRIIKFSSFPWLAIFLKLKNGYIWLLQWSAIHSKFSFSLDHKMQSVVIKSLKVLSN